MFLDTNLQNWSKFHILERSHYLFSRGVTIAMNTTVELRHNWTESCLAVEVSRTTQKVEIYLANVQSGVAFFNIDIARFWEPHRRLMNNEFC